MKIMNKLAAIIAAMAMCMTTISSSVSAKTLLSTDEGDYNENLTEEIVTEEEIPVEEEIPAEEEAVPVDEIPEETTSEVDSPNPWALGFEIAFTTCSSGHPYALVNGVKADHAKAGETVTVLIEDLSDKFACHGITVRKTIGGEVLVDVADTDHAEFVMPSDDVTVTMNVERVKPEHEGYYLVNVVYPLGPASEYRGTFSVKTEGEYTARNEAQPGSTVKIHYEPKAGYECTDFHIYDEAGKEYDYEWVSSSEAKFIMPEGNTYVEAVFENQVEHKITTEQSDGGKVLVQREEQETDKAFRWDKITVVAEPGPQYKLVKFEVHNAAGEPVKLRNGDWFEMPSCDVTVTAEFKRVLFNIAVEHENGTIEFTVNGEKATEAAKGDSIEISAIPDTGYDVVKMHVITSAGDSINTFPEFEKQTVIMPEDDITIKAQILKLHCISIVENEKIVVQGVSAYDDSPSDYWTTKDNLVTLFYHPIEGYEVEAVSIWETESGKVVDYNRATGQFKMPDADVTIQFKERCLGVKYVDENGTEHVCKEYTNVSEVQEGMGYGLSDGWYVLDKDVSFNEHRMTITGDVNLILSDGATLNVAKGIRCGTQYGSRNTLTIWAQKEGTGKIVCKGVEEDNAAIGGNEDEVGGTINIHGGIIEANGGYDGAGIGGGKDASCGTVNIYGGKVMGTGGNSGAGIGGGNHGSGGIINISGGIVYALALPGGAGIGGGNSGHGGTITISGGKIDARGAHYEALGGAGIGGGDDGNGGNIIIRGGTIDAYGAGGGAGIGGGDEGDGGSITIFGGNINAKGGKSSFGWGMERSGAGIGGGDDGDSGNITIHGGIIIATAVSDDAWYDKIRGVWGAGIGAGDDGSVNNIQILGGERIECHGFRAVGRGEDGQDGTIKLGDNIVIEDFNWSDRYTALSYGHDLVLKRWYMQSYK